MIFREGFGGVVFVGVLLSDIQGCWLRWRRGVCIVNREERVDGTVVCVLV
jgi:hypothetical protein